MTHQAMRPSFYHVRIEVYIDQQSATSSQSYLPPPGQNIFSTLPAHKTTNLPSSVADQGRDFIDTQAHDGHSQSHADVLLLPERNAALKHVPQPTERQLPELSQDTASQDWRFGPVSIDAIDMSPEGRTPPARKSDAHTKGIYIPSDVKTTRVGSGVVRLYRDIQESDLLARLQQKTTDSAPLDLDDCTTLCILAVPSWMMPSDLLGFVGEQTRTNVSHFRLIRTGRANKYMVLMKFRHAKNAREWQEAWNGRLFSAMEPENCHVVFVKSVEFVTKAEADESNPTSFPLNTHDPFTQGRTNTVARTPSAKPYAPPTPSLIELPTCPVCLERMDETTGLLTILCQHVFHCACLEKWRGSGCPVCRYTQSPSHTFPYPRPSGDKTEETEPLCSVCASSANLWICLICGNTGCGRYDSAHAYAHYEETSHCYAMDISTQRVWDYAGDGYVHRLMQNKGDEKMIQLPGARHDHPNSAFRAEGNDSVPREKMEAMANEYTYLLTNQLDSQRRYFEEQLERAVDKASAASQRAEEAVADAGACKKELQALQTQSTNLEETMSVLEKSLDKTKVRSDKFESLSRDLMRQVKEETALSAGLMNKIAAAEERAAESDRAAEMLRAEKAELEDSNRDLTIFISSQDKISELRAQGEDLDGANVAVPVPALGKGRGKGKGKGRKNNA